MRKLTYAIALSSLLLAGCSQDEGVMENKGELVTLNYNVSLGNDVQSRADGNPELAVNKLLCIVFERENGNEVKRDTVEIANGQAIYSPTLFSNINYRIAFWAYYADNEGNSCFNLADVKAIQINNEKYDKGNFIENKFKDAYTAYHDVTLTTENQTPSITLTRPFGMVNIYTSKADYEAALAMGSTPTTGTINIGSCSKTFNAYTQQWVGGNEAPVELNTEVSSQEVTFNGVPSYCLASEYVFANGTVTNTNIQVKDRSQKVIYNSTISGMPLGASIRTNLYNGTLLTGGGVTYTITINQGFTDNDKEI